MLATVSPRPWARLLRRWLGAGALAVTALATAGCGDTTGTDSRRLVGDWEATVFRLDDATFSEDLLASGGYLELRLFADGTTSGEIFVPGGDIDGSDFFERLDGTWTRSGNLVRFDHSADTFLRDMDFFVEADDVLVGDETFDGTRVRVVLERF